MTNAGGSVELSEPAGKTVEKYTDSLQSEDRLPETIGLFLPE